MKELVKAEHRCEAACSMVYKSKFNGVDADRYLMGCGLWPLRTTFSGPCPTASARRRSTDSLFTVCDAVGDGTLDVVDEALNNFKANIMFRQFKPEGPGDLVQIYLLLYIHQCIQK